MAKTSLLELYQIFQNHPAISTNSREIPPGCLFFALKGEKFDGNQFAKTVLENGAAFAIVDDEKIAATDPARLLLVPDVLKMLQDLAKMHRRTFDIPVIGIAGSNGKTTTKELVGAVLTSHYPCHVTAGNLNNHIGVPLTLLRMPAETEVAVIEIGANHIGEVAELCQIAEPTHGLLTNIGKEHLEGFGDLEGVKKAEGELYQFLAGHDGLAFVNRDEKFLASLSKKVKHRIFYKKSDKPSAVIEDFETKVVAQTPFLEVSFLDENDKMTFVKTQLFGRHNFQNVQTAIALGRYFKVPTEKIRAALENYQPKNNRSQFLKIGTNSILMDAYNANPSSMKATLETLREMPGDPKIAILGDMLELGDASDREHQAIFNFAKKSKLAHLILVGKEFSKVKIGKSGAVQLPDSAAARAWFLENRIENALVLVKGSRGIRLEEVFLG